MLGEARRVFLKARGICSGQKDYRLDVLHQGAGSSSVFLIPVLGVQRQLVEVLQNDTRRTAFLTDRLHLVQHGTKITGFCINSANSS